MKYSIQLREGWIGFYDCRNGRYGVTANAPERILCSYPLAWHIAQTLRERGIAARIQPAAGIEHAAWAYNALK